MPQGCPEVEAVQDFHYGRCATTPEERSRHGV